jgi:hypothetical protein
MIARCTACGFPINAGQRMAVNIGADDKRHREARHAWCAPSTITPELDDAEALEHYRAECRRLRAGIRAVADTLEIMAAPSLAAELRALLAGVPAT